MSAITAFLDAIDPAFLDGDPEAHVKPAEAENVQRVRALYETIARGDAAAFADAFALDVRMHIAGPAELRFSGEWDGRARVLEAIRRNFSLVDDQRPVVEVVVAQGDSVVVLFVEAGRVREMGRP